MSEMIEIEIDGKTCPAKAGQMVIQAADQAGVYIPRFCYHKHLSVAANCRMCLVEVEKAPKALPACATPVTPGMKVFTKSAKTIAAQKAVMEFLLINHPLDCPICDQGGECELQDLAMGYGSAKSCYVEGKRSVKDQDIGPLIATEMTRCIQCTRCVRFGDEVAGLRELGTINRGEDLEISTYVEKSITSEVSGNIIDLCPVGALTSKPFRFKARAWELDQYSSIAPHDCVGSNIHVHTRYGSVLRVAPRENNAINLTWISDRDRFSYEALEHPDRLTTPRIRVNGVWHSVDWKEALDYIVTRVKTILVQYGTEAIAALASPNATLEELFLLQKLLRQLGSPHIDHRLRQTDCADQAEMPIFPGLKIAPAELAECDAIVLVGSNIQQEQPVLGIHVRRAFLNRAQIMAVNMKNHRFSFSCAQKKIVAPQEMVATLASIASALGIAPFTQIIPGEIEKNIADVLRSTKNACVLVGALAMNHPEASAIRRLCRLIAEKTHAHIGFLTEGCNTAGAWLSGAIPHRTVGGDAVAKPGLTANELLTDPRKIYFLWNVEPELDCANPVAARHALSEAELVVAFTTFQSSALEAQADVLLPIAAFTETSGTYVNAAGAWQSFLGVAKPFAETRPGWKVLRVLANLLELEGFEYASSDEVRDAVRDAMQSAQVVPDKIVAEKISVAKKTGVYRIGEIPLYAADALVRRAAPLQKIQNISLGNLAAVRLHTRTAQDLKLSEGMTVTLKQKNSTLRLPLMIDDTVPVSAAYIAGGIVESSGLSELFGEVELVGAS